MQGPYDRKENSKIINSLPMLMLVSLNLDTILDWIHQGKYTFQANGSDSNGLDLAGAGAVEIQFSQGRSVFNNPFGWGDSNGRWDTGRQGDQITRDFSSRGSGDRAGSEPSQSGTMLSGGVDLTNVTPFANVKIAFEGLAEKQFTDLSSSLFSYNLGLTGSIQPLDPGAQVHYPDPNEEGVDIKRITELGQGEPDDGDGTVRPIEDELDDPNEEKKFNEDQIQMDQLLANFILQSQTDVDGRDLDISAIGMISFEAIISGVDEGASFQAGVPTDNGTSFIIVISYNGSPVLTLSVDKETGTIKTKSEDNDFWNGMRDGDSVVIKTDYTVTNGVSTDNSTLTITIDGVNDAPVDPDEKEEFTEDDIIKGLELTNFKLAGATDAEGDDIDVKSLDSGHVTASIDGQDASGDFSLVLNGFNVSISYKGDEVLTMTVNPETGTEQIISKDAAFWKGLDEGDSISISVGYTVTDNNGGEDTSTQTINIQGLYDPPVHDDCNIFPIYKPPFGPTETYMANGLLGLAAVQNMTDYFTDPAHTNNSDYTNAQYFTGPSGVPVSTLGSAAGDDIVFATSGNNINGGNGNDFLMDKSHKQDLNLTGGAGNDILIGGEKGSKLTGGACADFIYGGGGDDKINGGSGNDILVGGAGNDIIKGNSGNDTIYGGEGNDTLTGGSGQDGFLYDLALGAKNGCDVITDFDLAKPNKLGDVLIFGNVQDANHDNQITFADLDANSHFRVLEGNYNNNTGSFSSSSSGRDILVDLGDNGHVVIENIGPSIAGSGPVHSFQQLLDAGVNIVVHA